MFKKINSQHFFVVLILVFLLPVTMLGDITVANASWFGIDSIAAEWLTWMLSLVSYFVFVLIPTVFLYMSGLFFDAVLQALIVNFGYWYQSALIEPAVNMAWKISQSLANMIIISMFVYASVATILRLKDYNLDKFIVKILVVALLINFSMFFVKLSIDISNIIAYQIHSSMKETLGDTPGYSNAGIGGAIHEYITTQNDGTLSTAGILFMKFGIGSSLVNDRPSQDGAGDYLKRTFIVYPIIGIIIAISAGVLVYGAIVIMTRALGLILVLALSAIGFVMFIVPSFGDKYFKMWWESLLRYSIFAPVFMFMFYISMTIIISIGGGVDLQTALTGTKFAETMISAVIIIGLLYSTIKISNSLSITGSSFASDMALRVSSAGASTVLAPSRAVAGRIFERVHKSKYAPDGLKLAASRLYNFTAPARNSNIMKDLGIKRGLNYKQKDEIKSAEALRKFDLNKIKTQAKKNDADLSSKIRREASNNADQNSAKTKNNNTTTATSHSTDHRLTQPEPEKPTENTEGTAKANEAGQTTEASDRQIERTAEEARVEAKEVAKTTRPDSSQNNLATSQQKNNSGNKEPSDLYQKHTNDIPDGFEQDKITTWVNKWKDKEPGKAGDDLDNEITDIKRFYANRIDKIKKGERDDKIKKGDTREDLLRSNLEEMKSDIEKAINSQQERGDRYSDTEDNTREETTEDFYTENSNELQARDILTGLDGLSEVAKELDGNDKKRFNILEANGPKDSEEWKELVNIVAKKNPKLAEKIQHKNPFGNESRSGISEQSRATNNETAQNQQSQTSNVSDWLKNKMQTVSKSTLKAAKSGADATFRHMKDSLLVPDIGAPDNSTKKMQHQIEKAKDALKKGDNKQVEDMLKSIDKIISDDE